MHAHAQWTYKMYNVRQNFVYCITSAYGQFVQTYALYCIFVIMYMYLYINSYPYTILWDVHKCYVYYNMH